MANVRPPFWLGHDKDFLYKPRGFNSIEEHDEAIIQNWNELVSPDDTVFCLGDCMLNDNEGGCRKLNQLAGNIRIIYGNHDSANRIQMYSNIRPTILGVGFAYVLKYQGYSFYLSHYPTLCSNYDDDKPLKARTVSICGHSHTKDKFKDMDKGLIFHVELDTNNNKPWLLDDIITELKNYLNKTNN